jgi:hypothetical protein
VEEEHRILADNSWGAHPNPQHPALVMPVVVATLMPQTFTLPVVVVELVGPVGTE